MNAMPNLIRLSGPFGPALVVLGCVVLLLSVRAALVPCADGRGEGPSPRSLGNGVLFWGSASAVIGFLGQCHGVYLAMSSILAASELAPNIVAEGFVISFVPTLFGLGILSFAFVVWVTLRLLPTRTGRVIPMVLVTFLASGCGTRAQEAPVDLTTGVWALQADQNLFLWEFTSDVTGHHGCVVHDILDGLKFMETPCASVSLEGTALALEMPNGVRYEGRVDLGGGSIDGNLLYLDGSSREAPLSWALQEGAPDAPGQVCRRRPVCLPGTRDPGGWLGGIPRLGGRLESPGSRKHRGGRSDREGRFPEVPAGSSQRRSDSGRVFPRVRTG